MQTRIWALRRSEGLLRRASATSMRIGVLDISLMALTSVTSTTWRRGLASHQRNSCLSLISCCCRAPQRSVFVRFQPTPNDTCYKFYVDGIDFLPPETHTMMFDSSNSYLSPLAHTLLEALPMVEEVTVGRSFVTVKRVEVADTEAAARYFAMKFRGAHQSNVIDEAAAATRSQALQQHASDVLKEEGDTDSEAVAPLRGCNTTSIPLSSSSSDESFDMGGFSVSSSLQDGQLDEAVLQDMISSSDWSELKFHVSALLTDHISSGNSHVDPTAPNPHADTVPEEGDSEVVLMIKELVGTTIRPQLQEDGGDLRFVSFDPVVGDLHVELLGACRTCKSSKSTLVDMIERTTRHWIPEVKAVKDVSRASSVFQECAADRSAAASSSTVGLSNSLPTGLPTEVCDNTQLNAEGRVKFSPSSTSVTTRGAPGAFRIVREVRESSCGAAATTSAAATRS
ncbi:hypothetical protein JKF63_02067 [Porcisia hertigi]|uniref:Scaffold protein Nfu/NifU N-terminal domain-containing protein n=1 Tax=Porcisia hertigi TaxID=2761500 RepID=A0A836I1Z5_9TRYP|nr:hypothetical protein JKF63_02067 [Porcisia hertigi]